MKVSINGIRWTLCSVVVTTLICSLPLYAEQKEVPPDMVPNVQAFMEAKLQHSQAVLKGLATEDFDLIAANSQKVSLLSQAEQWQVIQTPDYVQRSTEFRREVDALTEAAKKKNLDAATLAYVKVTISCIECHKYVRSVRAAMNPTIRR